MLINANRTKCDALPALIDLVPDMLSAKRVSVAHTVCFLKCQVHSYTEHAQRARRNSGFLKSTANFEIAFGNLSGKGYTLIAVKHLIDEEGINERLIRIF